MSHYRRGDPEGGAGLIILIGIVLVLATLAAILWLMLLAQPVAAECEPEPITPNTPTGIAGCERWGDGIASHYGPGTGVAMNFCTWEVRHTTGCGWVLVQSHATGIAVTVPVVDYCDCYFGTSNERIVDLQYDVVAALGLDRSAGLYPVTVWPAEGVPAWNPAPPEPTPPPTLPDTAVLP